MPHQEADQADLQEEVPSRRRRGGINPALGSESAKRRHIPRRRHSPSLPRLMAARRNGRPSAERNRAAGGMARGVAGSRTRRGAQNSAVGAAGGVTGGGAMVQGLLSLQQEEPSQWRLLSLADARAGSATMAANETHKQAIGMMGLTRFCLPPCSTHSNKELVSRLH